MTAGEGGTPEEDPFDYLYRGNNSGEQGGDGSAPAQQPQQASPRIPYTQATRVGATRPSAGQWAQQPQQPPAVPQQQAPGAGYPGQAPPPAAPGGHGGGTRRSSGGGPSRGLLIGGIAVALAVVIGVVVAVTSSGGGKKQHQATPPTSGGTASAGASASAGGSSTAPSPSSSPTVWPSADASKLTLAGGAQLTTSLPDGSTASAPAVGGFDQQGASATWTVTAPKSGPFALTIYFYNGTKKKEDLTMVVNGKAVDRPVTMGKWADGKWNVEVSTWATVDLNKGQNSIQLTCGKDTKKCKYLVSRVKLGKDKSS